MKNVYILLALLVFSIPAVATIGRFGGGSESTSDPEKEWIIVKNGESSALAKGDLVSASVSADDGVTVLLTTTAGQEVMCVVDEAIAAGKFGKCQVYGYHSAVKVNGTTVNISAGGRVAAASHPGKGDGTGAGESIGRALDAATGSTTIPMWLKLR